MEVEKMAGGRWAFEHDDEVKKALDHNHRIGMVDVQSPKEFTGEILAPPEYPTEHAQRGGHIPGGSNPRRNWKRCITTKA
jgi:3-mercaptopyruvate sulfurtransferase SseA